MVKELIEGIKTLFEGTVSWIFKVIRYFAWGTGLLGIPLSIVLIFANIKGGVKAVVLMVSTLFLSIALTLLLMPTGLIGMLPAVLQTYRVVVGVIALVIASIVAVVIFFSKGKFPELNLLITTVKPQ